MESQMTDAVNPATKLAGDRTNMASFRTHLALVILAGRDQPGYRPGQEAALDGFGRKTE